MPLCHIIESETDVGMAHNIADCLYDDFVELAIVYSVVFLSGTLHSLRTESIFASMVESTI